jgi:hypothetical protein
MLLNAMVAAVACMTVTTACTPFKYLQTFTVLHAENVFLYFTVITNKRTLDDASLQQL